MRNKYHAKKAPGSLNFPEISNRSFDSQFERTVATDLCIRQRAGEISDLKFQTKVELTAADIGWKIDFSYVEDGELIYHEAKGFETPDYRLKLRLYRVYGPALLRVTKGNTRSRVTREYYPSRLNQV